MKPALKRFRFVFVNRNTARVTPESVRVTLLCLVERARIHSWGFGPPSVLRGFEQKETKRTKGLRLCCLRYLLLTEFFSCGAPSCLSRVVRHRTSNGSARTKRTSNGSFLTIDTLISLRARLLFHENKCAVADDPVMPPCSIAGIAEVNAARAQTAFAGEL